MFIGVSGSTLGVNAALAASGFVMMTIAIASTDSVGL